MKQFFQKIKKSKTIIFNILLGVLGVLELNMGMFQTLLGDYYGVTFMVIAIIGVILRTITTQPLNEK